MHVSTSATANRARARVSNLDAHLGFWLRFVSNHVSRAFRKRVEERGVTVSEWVALRELYSRPSSSGELVDALGMTKGAVSKVLGRLVQKDLVRRASDPDDARKERISLTPKGRHLVPKLAALADANDAHFFGGLSAAQRRVLAHVLRKIVDIHRLTQVPTE
jgi:DNA-binding MarR family transcriptional regulator